MAIKLYIITLLVGFALGVIFSKPGLYIAAVHILLAFAFIIMLGYTRKANKRIPLVVSCFLLYGVGLFLLFYGADKYLVYDVFIFLKFSLPTSLPLALIFYLHQKKKLSEGTFHTTKKIEGEIVDKQMEVLGKEVYISYMALPVREIKVLLALSGFIIFTLFTWGFFIFTNGFLDNSPPQNHQVIVIKKKSEFVGSNRYNYYIFFIHWDREDTKKIEVTEKFWESVKEGDAVNVKAQKGFYNIEWVSVGRARWSSFGF